MFTFLLNKCQFEMLWVSELKAENRYGFDFYSFGQDLQDYLDSKAFGLKVSRCK
jgi:hypothetical protein